MRASGSNFNTHIMTVKGIVSTEENNHIAFDRKPIDIRCTSDVRGETFSVTYKGLQIALKVKDIEKLIAETREDRKDVA